MNNAVGRFLVLFKDGQEVDRVVGAVPKSTLMARLQPHLN
jgi:thioredoxin-like negative regulator of GroEL